jgi:phosphatidylinositol alpha-mannosyltransferase
VHRADLSRTVRRKDRLRHSRAAWRAGATRASLRLAGWAVQTLAAYAVLYALNLQGKAGLAAAAAILLAVNLTALVPITPSNIGIFQAATIAVLTAHGVDAGHALAYGILLQAVEITTAIALGVPALLGERISLNDIRRYATATPTLPPSQLKT